MIHISTTGASSRQYRRRPVVVVPRTDTAYQSGSVAERVVGQTPVDIAMLVVTGGGVDTR